MPTTKPFTLWADADGLPNDVKDVILRAAERRSVRAVFVANKPLRLPRLPTVSFVQVGAGLDVADSYIVKESEAGDLCITHDIPLAAELVRKGVVAIDVRGDLHTEATISERLSIRDFMAGLRGAGVQTGGPQGYDAKAKQRFAGTLDRELTRRLSGG